MLLEDCSTGLCRAQKPRSVDRVDGTLGSTLEMEYNGSLRKITFRRDAMQPRAVRRDTASSVR
jgi:hypothetical protein